MVKRFAALLGITLLGACMGEFPQSAAETRSLAGSNTVTVASDMAKTRAALGALSRNCYNRVVNDNVIYRIGPYGPQSLIQRQSFQSTVSTSGGVTTLSVRKKYLSGINPGQPDNGFIALVIDAKSDGSGQVALTAYGGAFGNRGILRDFKKVIESGKVECVAFD